MTTTHSDTVKQNFEQKAAEYDDFMLKSVPHYHELIESLVHALPFSSSDQLKICDLGSGTGNVTKLLIEAYPNAKITCVDISPMMTDMAKLKLNNANVNFEIADFNDYEFSAEYDIIVSSLALHHLVSDEDKKDFYKRIYNALKLDGVFFNADIVIAASDYAEEQIMEQWKEWLRQYHTEKDLMEMVINRYYEEDRPTTVTNHLNWMQEIGFRNVDVISRQLKGAVYGGYK